MDERIASLSGELIEAVKSGRVTDRDQLQNLKLKLCKMDARAYVDGKLAAEAQITAAIGDRPKA